MATTRKSTCPICSKPTAQTFNPFCSARCADVDLGRWFTESYRVPTVDAESDADEIGDDDDLEG